MYNKIPLPTDNIYKFYALFGLLVFVFGLASILYTVRSTNEFVSSGLVQLEVLKTGIPSNLVDQKRREVLERRLEIAVKDRRFFEQAGAWLAAGGFWVMAFGFWMWHRKIQPLQDELLDLQLQKLRREAVDVGTTSRSRRLRSSRR